MRDLFGEPERSVPGLNYFPDYIERADETDLITLVDENDWMHDLKRRVQHYGFRYDYKSRQVLAESYLGNMPSWLDVWCNRLHEEGHCTNVPDQVIVNEYLPGQGIASHVDRIHCFGDPIIILSLGSSCVMDFTHIATGEKIPTMLGVRSLAVIRESPLLLGAWNPTAQNRPHR